MSLTSSHLVPFARDDVWAWHERSGAVARLTPPFIPMSPIQEAHRLSDGTTIFGLPAGLKWIARHDLSGYQRGYRFTDICISAPMKAVANWRHVHSFADAPEGTRITDTVTTRLPGSTLTSMFAYRQNQLIQDMSFLDRMKSFAPDTPLTIAMTGSRGIVGRALSAQLRTAEHTVVQLVRKEPREGQREWDPHNPSPDLLEGIDVLIHLAGEPILGRFNDSHKKAIHDSRVEPTQKLAALVAHSPTCQTMISASAIGYYGSDRGDEVLAETSEPGEGFLADVCRGWEAATQAATDAGKRVVHVRTGVVLSGRGGMLPVLKTLFSTGLGGKFGDGSTWFSWIALDDLTDIYFRAVVDKQLAGPINGVSPNPVRNAEMATTLAAGLNRPAFIQIPSFGPKLLLGSEGAEELALANQNVEPAALRELDHTFRYPTFEAAIAHELGREELFDAASPEDGEEVPEAEEA